jgi:hypothetical protein
MKLIFGSGTSVVLLNGVLGKVFHCLRGVKQGDPLSPRLFVLAADSLQSILNSLKQSGLLCLPFPLPGDDDFPILQYADDTLIFMQADLEQLAILKDLLVTFATSSGLRVNFENSLMLPINVPNSMVHTLATAFGCSKDTLPFTYLGLPLSLTKHLCRFLASGI